MKKILSALLLTLAAAGSAFAWSCTESTALPPRLRAYISSSFTTKPSIQPFEVSTVPPKSTLFEKEPLLLTFGEDTGKIGDVNQGLRGMQVKYGEERIFDTGIREWSIMGQAIGLAMRGLRPMRWGPRRWTGPSGS